jgi:hypothetical protein
VGAFPEAAKAKKGFDTGIGDALAVWRLFPDLSDALVGLGVAADLSDLGRLDLLEVAARTGMAVARELVRATRLFDAWIELIVLVNEATMVSSASIACASVTAGVWAFKRVRSCSC